MLKHLQRVLGIGRLRHSQRQPLARCTLVYAPNGSGKSTIAMVLHSLGSGDIGPLRERPTIGSTQEMEAEIAVSDDTSETTVHLSGSGWTTTVPTIRVFDAAFVYSNLYVGPVVTADQRSKLHRFVLGTDNVRLSEEIDDLDTKVRECTTQLAQLERELVPYAQPYTPTEFIALVPQPDVAARLEDAGRRLALAERASELAQQGGFRFAPTSELEHFTIDDWMAIDIGYLAGRELRSAQEHIDRLGPGAMSWLATGHLLIPAIGGSCPYCAASLADNSLIDAYRTLFDAAYARAIDELNLAQNAAHGLSTGALLTSLTRTSAHNDARAEYWRAEGIIPPDNRLIEQVLARATAAGKLLESAIGEKKDRLNTPLTGNLHAAEAGIAIGDATRLLGEYNTSVQTANTAIAGLRDLARSLPIESLRAEEAQLKAGVRWSEDAATQLRTHHRTTAASKTALQAEKEEAKERLENSLAALTPDLIRRINDFLRQTGADFSIDDIETGYGGGTPRAAYALRLNGAVIPLTQRGRSPYHVGSVMSEGDRSTLAFAFFLARLESEPSPSSLIAVIDDPITSQDASRRAYTGHRITQCAASLHQLIILSHDAYFLKQMRKDIAVRLQIPRGDILTLSIERQGTTSEFREWDPESSTTSDYDRHYKTVANFLLGRQTDPRGAAEALRPLLEGYLRRRFPLEFPSSARMIGNRLDAIRSALPDSPLAAAQSQLEELGLLNDFAKRFHHDENPDSGSEAVNPTELRTMAALLIGLIRK